MGQLLRLNGKEISERLNLLAGFPFCTCLQIKPRRKRITINKFNTTNNIKVYTEKPMNSKGYKRNSNNLWLLCNLDHSFLHEHLKPIPQKEEQNIDITLYNIMSMASTGENPFDQRVPASPQSNQGVQQSDPPLPHRLLIDHQRLWPPLDFRL